MPALLPPEEAAALRASFMENFVNTSTEWYQKIAKKKPVSILLVYDINNIEEYGMRFLWGTLQREKFEIVPFCDCMKAIAKRKKVLSLWDIRPRRVVYLGRGSSPYPPSHLKKYRSDAILLWETDELLPLLRRELADYDATPLETELPEDLYIFDEDFSFCAIFTHESPTLPFPGRKGERLCFLCRES